MARAIIQSRADGGESVRRACTRSLVAAGNAARQARERARERRRQDLRDRGAGAGRGVRLGHGDGGQRCQPRRAGEPSSTASLYQPGAHAPPARPAARDATAATGTPSGSSSSTSRARGAKNGGGGGRETVLAVVGAALRDSIRLVDETFRLEEDAHLRPGAEPGHGRRGADGRAAARPCSTSSSRGGGLRIAISAGVVACPDHGADADGLLHKADEAMWRARAVGPAGRASARCRLCKIADRFREICP